MKNVHWKCIDVCFYSVVQMQRVLNIMDESIAVTHPLLVQYTVRKRLLTTDENCIDDNIYHYFGGSLTNFLYSLFTWTVPTSVLWRFPARGL